MQDKKFDSFRDARGVNGLSYAANRKILACSGGSLENFLVEKSMFFENKKIFTQSVCILKF